MDSNNSDTRNINTEGGNYNEKIEGDYYDNRTFKDCTFHIADVAEKVESKITTSKDKSTVSISPSTPLTKPKIKTFQFKVAKLRIEKSGFLRKTEQLIPSYHRKEAKYYIEDFGDGVALEMLYIPRGKFLMGSSESDKHFHKSETPQHEVNIDPFYIGNYPVTQKQWKAIANLPQVNQPLDPEPSKFKGNYHPVEQVSWNDAMEFCERLSVKTKREYRLPSEAQWEYVCRARTQTLFHFGDVISPKFANYGGRQTTQVGSFNIANAFGIHDMHGNVSEWCADHWHANYKKAPINGEPWLRKTDNQLHVTRGGSHGSLFKGCRCAYRTKESKDKKSVYIGFRVICLSFS